MDGEDCRSRERRERHSGDREGRGAKVTEVAGRRERRGSDRKGKDDEVAEVAVGLKLRAWRRSSALCCGVAEGIQGC